MKLCNDVITIFNAYLDKGRGADIYLPTVISGVSWYLHTITTVDSGNGGLRAANQFTVRIPINADFSGKAYALPRDYAEAADPSQLFTLKAGDIVVHGAYPTAPLHLADIKALGGETVTVLAVTDNRRAPKEPHWRVVGK